MGFLNTNSMPRLVEKLADGDNIKITGNSKGNRVGTVIKKIVEKADDVTKAVEQEVVNDSYSFKIGTGDVDVSADVEDGFGEVGVKGVTYQNCLKFTDDITFNLNLENWNIRAISSDKILVKPNTVYTMIIYVSNVTVSHNELLWVGDVSGNKNSITDEIIRKNVTMGINTFKFTTNSNPEDKGIRFQGSKFVEGVLTFKPLLLEGDHTNNPNLPSYFEDIIGVGDKSKNLFNGELELGGYTGSAGTPFVDSTRVRTKTKTLLSSGDYVVSSEESTLFSVCEYNVDGTFIREHHVNSNHKYFKLEGDRLVHFQTVNPNLLNSKIQLEKGTTPTEYQPPNTHKIEILSNGKNLWDLKNKSFKGFIEGNYGNLSSPDCQNRTSDFIRIKPNTDYTYMTTVDVSSSSHPASWNAIAWYDEGKNYITRTAKTGNTMGVDTVICTLHSPSNAKYVRVGSRYLESELSKATLSEGVISEHIPYVEDKTQILLDEPLMRLPDGTCDEITSDGKLIRRVGKYTFNGSEGFVTATSSVDVSDGYFTCYASRLNSNIVSNGGFICDKFKYYKYDADFRTYKNEESCSDGGGYKRQYFRISSSKLTENTMAGFKKWLQENPTTVYYKFATPVITDIAPATLRIFKDGHLRFNTLVAPESTHLVQLNKSAQIERSVREVQSLDSRVKKLESFYDEMILETSHKLNLLTYDFEYTKESEDI